MVPPGLKVNVSGLPLRLIMSMISAYAFPETGAPPTDIKIKPGQSSRCCSTSVLNQTEPVWRVDFGALKALSVRDIVLV
eukprot:COSAG02_NODE_7544_length_2968_cov_2.344371_3_plen_78_part_01